MQNMMVNSSGQTDSISGLYQSLVQHKIHQDQLLWSRIQTVSAIQVGVIGGGFAIHSAWKDLPLGGGLLVIGGLLTLVLFYLIIGDYADMEVNDDIMKRLAERLLPSDLKDEGKEIKWTGKRILPSWLSGHRMIYSMVILFISVDFILGICLLCRLSMFG